MNCAACHKPISAAQAKRQIVEKDEQGRIKRIIHEKCKRVAVRRAGMGPDGKYFDSTPTPYEEALQHKNATDLEILAARQQEIAEERAKEEVPKGFKDWRDPAELDV